MNWRDLQHNPIVFWTLAFFAVAWPAWSYYTDLPSREISYFLETKPLVSVDDFGASEFSINGQRVTEGIVYKNKLYIWNSGNTDLLIDDFGEPIQWTNAPTTIQWSDFPIKTDIQEQGLGKDQFEGELVPGPVQTGLRFKKMYAGSGVIASFLSKSEPDVSLSGSVSGAGNGSGLIKRKIYTIEDFGAYALGVWLFFFLFFLVMFWRDESSKSYRDKFGPALVLATGPVFIGMVVVEQWLNYGLPPF